MGLDIYIQDIDTTYTKFCVYASPCSGNLSEAFSRLKESIRELTVMRTLQGPAAESIKTYFAEYHLPLISKIECLAGQLQTDFASQYLAGYQNSPLNESAHARLPEAELDSISMDCSRARYDFLQAVKHNLQKIPASDLDATGGYIPDTSSLEIALEDVLQKTNSTKSYLNEVEQKGKHTFSQNNGIFSSLLSAITSYISLPSTSITSYRAGAIYAYPETNSLLSIAGASAAAQKSLKEQTSKATQNSFNNVILRNERKTSNFLHAEQGMKKIDSAFSVAGIIGNACAVGEHITESLAWIGVPKCKEATKFLGNTRSVITSLTKGWKSCSEFVDKYVSQQTAVNEKDLTVLKTIRDAQNNVPSYLKEAQ